MRYFIELYMIHFIRFPFFLIKEYFKLQFATSLFKIHIRISL